MIVCVCHNVSDKAIRKAVHNGTCSLRGLSRELKVATQCGKCACTAQAIVREELQREPRHLPSLLPNPA